MTRKPRFFMGQTVITHTALRTLTPEEVIAALANHVAGDWGDVDRECHEANELGVDNDGQVVSRFYSDSGQTKFYVVTDWDRSQTTILLPGDC